jgi:hypothetical protein
MQISELAREMGANKYDKKCGYSNLKPISNLLSIIPQTKKKSGCILMMLINNKNAFVSK